MAEAQPMKSTELLQAMLKPRVEAMEERGPLPPIEQA